AGTDSSVWQVRGVGDTTIQGFATDISVNKGQTVHFKIRAPKGKTYHLDIYRLGYYAGNGARLVGTGVVTASFNVSQPVSLYDAATGLTDCGNWGESAHWDVPSTAVLGIYLARLIRNDTGAASHVIFMVPDDARHSDVLVQTSDAT